MDSIGSTLKQLTVRWPALSLKDPVYLDSFLDIWYFVTIWCVVFCAFIYVLVSLWAYLSFRKYPSSLFIPPLFLLAGALTGFIGGTMFGLSVALIYIAGSFKLSTWIAMLWGGMHALFLLLGSYSLFDSLL